MSINTSGSSTSTFNPHEILARLRAKTSQSVINTENVSVSVQSITSLKQGPSDQNIINSKNNSISWRPPVTVPVTNQDNLEIRTELENEIKRLKSELAKAKQEKETAIKEKNEVNEKFTQYKTKADDTITKLRGKLANASKYTNNNDNKSGGGKMYPPSPSPMKNNNNLHLDMNNINDLDHPVEGFRDPTFSELMRRSSNNGNTEFQSSLRKNKKNIYSESPINKSSNSNIYSSPAIEKIKPNNRLFNNSNNNNNNDDYLDNDSNYRPGSRRNMSLLSVSNKKNYMDNYNPNDEDEDLPIVEIDLRSNN